MITMREFLILFEVCDFAFWPDNHRIRYGVVYVSKTSTRGRAWYGFKRYRDTPHGTLTVLPEPPNHHWWADSDAGQKKSRNAAAVAECLADAQAAVRERLNLVLETTLATLVR